MDQDVANTTVAKPRKKKNSPNPTVTRACDNCYHKREKCTYTLKGAECDQCQWHATVCVYNRPIRPVGRPRLLPPSRMASYTERRMPHTLNPFGVLFKDLQPSDIVAVGRFVDPKNFTALGVAPRVLCEMHRQAVHSLFHNFEDLNDGYFSMYEALATAVSINVPGFDFEANIQRMAVALRRFRNMPCPKDVETFQPWLWLATVILVHAHCAFGTNCLSLRRYMLTQLDDLGDRGAEFRAHPVIVCVAIQELLESLLQCRKPISNVPDCDLMPIDPFFGLASGLLRILFELCEVRYAIGNGESASFEDTIHRLETSVSTWQPDTTSQFTHHVTATEVTHALTQARALQTMMLLFIQRLRSSVGQETSSVEMMADGILSDIDRATAMTGKPPLWVTLPFIVAALEVTDPLRRDKALDDIAVYVDPVSARSRENCQRFFQAVWASRDSSPGFNWVKSTNQLPPVCITIG